MRRRLVVLAWLAGLLACSLIVARTPFLTDMSAFLPRDPGPAERLLVRNLREGVAARVLLLAIDGVAPTRIGEVSSAFAEALRAIPDAALVANGSAAELDAQRALVFARRYQLSPAVSPARFTVEGLRESIGATIAGLAASTGLLAKRVFARDPTGELIEVLRRLEGGAGPRRADGVWVDQAGRRALLMLVGTPDGTDLDAQQRLMVAARSAFARVLDARPGALEDGRQARLVIVGTPAFAVASRESIRDDVTRLSAIGGALIVALLWFALRSPAALALTLVPMASAVLAGAAAVAFVFGSLHGLTLAFGATLVGESVDYALYQLVQAPRVAPADAPAYRRTLRLGVATSVLGFAALLFSGFPGLAQLAVFSIAGLLVAYLLARHLLPALLPAGVRVRDHVTLDARLARLAITLTRLRWPLAALVVVAGAYVGWRGASVWDADPAALNPVSAAAQRADHEIRAALGAPDARVLLVVEGADADAVLEAIEALHPALDGLVADGAIAGYDSPASLLPSVATQRARLAALPSAAELRARLERATQGLPVRADRLEPFVADVAAAREAPLLSAADLAASTLGVGLGTRLLVDGARASGLVGLRAPPTGDIDLGVLQARLAAARGDGAARAAGGLTVLDLKAQTERLYAGYLREARVLAGLGAAGVVALLAVATGSLRALAAVCLPLAGAIVLVVALLVAGGARLNLLHLIGLSLVVAVGSNYALFFRFAGAGARSTGTLPALLFANLTTVSGFGVLAASQVPLLAALGASVGAGAALALLLAAAWSGGRGA